MRKFGFGAWLALLLVAPSAMASAQPLEFQPHQIQQLELRHLEQRLATTARENPGEYGIAALDLATGQTIGVNADMAFPMASTMKIAVAAAYLAEVDARRRSLGETIGPSTAYELMDRMMVRSDNRATDELIATLGGPAAIHRWLRGHGLEGIRVDRDIADLLAARRDLWDVRDSSTPLAMLELLRLIDGDRALSAQSRATLMDMMRRCATGSNRIRGLMPPGTVVEHKTGTLNRYTTDVGFVTLPDGRRLAVAFFARGGDNRPAVIATAARAIYDGSAPRLAAANPAPGTVQTTLQGGGRALLSAEY